MSRRVDAGLIARFSPSRITPGHRARPLAADLARLAHAIASELPDTLETRHALTKLLEARGAILVAAGWTPRRPSVERILPAPTRADGTEPPPPVTPGRHGPGLGPRFGAADRRPEAGEHRRAARRKAAAS